VTAQTNTVRTSRSVLAIVMSDAQQRNALAPPICTAVAAAAGPPSPFSPPLPLPFLVESAFFFPACFGTAVYF
jgi:hypothetical protein